MFSKMSTVLFRDPSCAVKDWYIWDEFTADQNVDTAVKYLRGRYPQYEWHAT